MYRTEMYGHKIPTHCFQSVWGEGFVLVSVLYFKDQRNFTVKADFCFREVNVN